MGRMGYSIGAATFPARRMEPGLYVVATPIGNLGDITLRALETLSSASVIACEDTRVTARLLQRYAISVRMVSYHEHNAAEAGPPILERVAAGEAVALVSDAGTPLISDPGARLVAEARRRGLPVWPVPGASAPVAALSAAGLPSDAFLFAGFLPVKQAARKARLQALAAVDATLGFFESPNRIDKTLADIAAVMGPQRRVSVCRELTKMHEEIVTATAPELAERYAGGARGEIVLLVEPAPQEREAADPDELLSELLGRMSLSEAAAEAARLTGLPRRTLYQRALALAARDGEEP